MADDVSGKAKPDLTRGVSASTVREGDILAGQVGEAHVMLTRVAGEVVAFGSECPHLGAPLEQGLCTGSILRCPWHHARFDLRTGEAIAAPAFDALPRWKVETDGDRVVVRERVPEPKLPIRPFEGHSEPGLVIVGGGAAGYAAAHELRRRGHEGPVTMVSDDPNPPYDRTLLTKDYLDGKFGDDRLPIARKSLDDLGITFLNQCKVEALDCAAHHLKLSDGRTLPYTKLLLATGAEPNRLEVPGADLPHVRLLRTLEDCRAILAGLNSGTKVVVVGSSFIGLETAASIRSRSIDVTVVTPEATPMAKLLGPDLSRTILSKHRSKGVKLRTEAKVSTITGEAVHLADGSRLPADLVIVGIGVTPRTELASRAGLWVEDGVMADRLLQTSDPDVFVAGDIARWPDLGSEGTIRVEHWVIAERQGQVAAANMLGAAEPYTDVPFFWSKHFDFSFRYVGHAEGWDDLSIEGNLEAGKAVLRLRKNGRDRAAITVGEDAAALRIEHAMESEAQDRGPAPEQPA